MLKRCFKWLRSGDVRLFLWCNLRFAHKLPRRLLIGLTHMGGAFFTVSVTLFVALTAPDPWRTAGWQSFAALALSHGAAVVIKRSLQRPRPYAALEQAALFVRRLPDYSFPSGHTTAAFSIATPFLFAASWLPFVLLPLAGAIALSRVCLGVHYPSDCIAGGLIGTAAALAAVHWLG